MDSNHDKVIQSLLWSMIGYEPIWIEMSQKVASGQVSEAILRSPASAHDGPQKVRDERKSVQDLSVLGHFAKTDVRYWQRTIFRQTYMRNGETRVTKDWADFELRPINCEPLE